MSAPGCRMHGSAPLLITAIAEHEAGINANRLNIYLPSDVRDDDPSFTPLPRKLCNRGRLSYRSLGGVCGPNAPLIVGSAGHISLEVDLWQLSIKWQFTAVTATDFPLSGRDIASNIRTAFSLNRVQPRKHPQRFGGADHLRTLP